MSNQGNRPVWDDKLATSLQGALVLVGQTLESAEGVILDRRQFYGRVIQVVQDKGIQLQLSGSNEGHYYWFPPDTRPFAVAKKGEYRLRATGEVVTDPDFTCAWTVIKPAENPASKD